MQNPTHTVINYTGASMLTIDTEDWFYSLILWQYLQYLNIPKHQASYGMHLPNLGAFRPHKGLKWSVRQIFPPRYIWKKIRAHYAEIDKLEQTEILS
jgi:hypothetical protein